MLSWGHSLHCFLSESISWAIAAASSIASNEYKTCCDHVSPSQSPFRGSDSQEGPITTAHSGQTIVCPLQPQQWGCGHCSQSWYVCGTSTWQCVELQLPASTFWLKSKAPLQPTGPEGLLSYAETDSTHYLLCPFSLGTSRAVVFTRSLESAAGACYIRTDLNEMDTNKIWVVGGNI